MSKKQDEAIPMSWKSYWCDYLSTDGNYRQYSDHGNCGQGILTTYKIQFIIFHTFLENENQI